MRAVSGKMGQADRSRMWVDRLGSIIKRAVKQVLLINSLDVVCKRREVIYGIRTIRVDEM